MKKILIFSLNYYPLVGGAEVAIKEITDRLSPDEYEIHMVCLQVDSSLPREEQIGNVMVHRIGFTTKSPSMSDLQKFPQKLNKYYFQIAAYRAALSLHQKYHFDILWAMMAHSCAIPAGLFKKRVPSVKYVLTLQEGDPPEYIERLMRPVWSLFKQGFTRADALQSISTFLQKWGERMGFRGKSVVIPNAVNVARFAHSYSVNEIDSMKDKLGKKEGEVFVVTTSRLVHKNAVDDVIRALPLLPENVSFLIYGVGPNEAMLRALAKELHVEDRARFMGEISQGEMPLMLKACDMFIRPSRSEGMGISFIEAMATGLPVIATKVGGISDFLFDEKQSAEHTQTGWSVDPNAPEQIASVIKDIITQSERATEVTQAAKAMVTEKYDWDTIAPKMKELFDELLKNG